MAASCHRSVSPIAGVGLHLRYAFCKPSLVDSHGVPFPDIPFEILRHDTSLSEAQELVDPEVEALWTAGQQAFAELAPPVEW